MDQQDEKGDQSKRFSDDLMGGSQTGEVCHDQSDVQRAVEELELVRLRNQITAESPELLVRPQELKRVDRLVTGQSIDEHVVDVGVGVGTLDEEHTLIDSELDISPDATKFAPLLNLQSQNQS